MIFKLAKSKWYPKYWETKNYAIGVSYETLDKFRVEFLCRLNKEDWTLLRTWTSYKWDLVAKLIRTIFDRLKDLEDENPKNKYGENLHWEIVEDFLPEKRQGLLEE